MEKRSLRHVKALLHEWGEWRRREDSVANLGYQTPSLIPTFSKGTYFTPQQILLDIDEAISIMKEDEFEGYALLRERYYYKSPLKECAKRYGVTDSKASQILDGLLAWIDGRIYKRRQ